MSAEAGTHGNDSTGAEQPSSFTWSIALFLLIAEPGSGRETERLAVCAEHDGQHVRYIFPDGSSWCQALPPQAPRRRAPRKSESAAANGRVEFGAEQLREIIAEATAKGYRRGRADEQAGRRR